MTTPLPVSLTMPTPDEVTWMDGSLCSTVDPNLWTSGRPCDQRVAAHYCHTCEAEPVCLDWALVRKEPRGTWGGQTAAERQRMLHEMEAGPVPAPSDAPKV
jgi:hypothetical protein